MSRPDGYLLPDGITVDRIVTEVARGFGVTVEELLGPGRRSPLFIARACAMAVIRESTTWSFSQIGRYFGKDHATVTNAVDKVMSDSELSHAVQLVIEELTPPPRLFAVNEPISRHA